MKEYINLSGVAEKVGAKSSGYLVQSWMRDSRTLEFLKLWEERNNPNFKICGYDELVESGVTITPKNWIEKTKAIGIKSKQGRNGGTFAVREIACEYLMYNSARYRLAMIEVFCLIGGDEL